MVGDGPAVRRYQRLLSPRQLRGYGALAGDPRVEMRVVACRAMRAAPVLTAILALLLAAPATAAERATGDRPDDFSGAQVHLVYAIPSDGVDRGLDTGGQIAQTISNFQAWMRAQAGGRALRFDTAGGALDVTFVRLPAPDTTFLAKGRQLRDELERQLKPLGFTAWDKIYEVFYDGVSPGPDTCGGGSWPPTLVGNTVALYLHGTFAVAPPCLGNPLPTSDGTPGYWGFSAGHEVLHAIGLAPTCAPHHTRAGHTSDSPTDLMYAGDEGWQPAVLDVGHDDYFMAGIPGCASLEQSAFFDGGTQMPPGWPAKPGTVVAPQPVVTHPPDPRPQVAPSRPSCRVLALRYRSAHRSMRRALKVLQRARRGRRAKLLRYQHWQRVEGLRHRRYTRACR